MGQRTSGIAAAVSCGSCCDRRRAYWPAVRPCWHSSAQHNSWIMRSTTTICSDVGNGCQHDTRGATGACLLPSCTATACTAHRTSGTKVTPEEDTATADADMWTVSKCMCTCSRCITTVAPRQPTAPCMHSQVPHNPTPSRFSCLQLDRSATLRNVMYTPSGHAHRREHKPCVHHSLLPSGTTLSRHTRSVSTWSHTAALRLGQCAQWQQHSAQHASVRCCSSHFGHPAGTATPVSTCCTHQPQCNTCSRPQTTAAPAHRQHALSNTAAAAHPGPAAEGHVTDAHKPLPTTTHTPLCTGYSFSNSQTYRDSTQHICTRYSNGKNTW
jgi:hypothetical protein